MKKSAIALCICMIALLPCACSNDDSQSPEGTGVENSVLTEDTVLTENTESEITEQGTEPQTEAEKIVIEIVDNPNYNIEETNDIKIARDFVIAYESAIENREETDWGKYVSNPFLKTYLAQNVKYFIEDGFRTGHEEVSIYVWAEPIEVNGINYIEFNIDHDHNQPYDGGCCVGMRDGKVVNFNNPYRIDLYQYLWCDDVTYSMEYKVGLDVTELPNPWDNDEIAERLVKAQELWDHSHGEYKLFEDAWNSLGE